MMNIWKESDWPTSPCTVTVDWRHRMMTNQSFATTSGGWWRCTNALSLQRLTADGNAQIPCMNLSRTVGHRGNIFMGLSSPMVFQPLAISLCPLFVTFWELAFSQSRRDSCLHLEEEEREDPDLHFHQAISSLSEGNPLDLDLGVALCFSFGREGLDHLVWSCLLHLVHRFEFPTLTRGIEVRVAC